MKGYHLVRNKSLIKIADRSFKHLKNYQKSKKYLDCKSKLDESYSKKANRVRTRGKCDWYESNEKSKKFFLNLEKTRASQGLICTYTC